MAELKPCPFCGGSVSIAKAGDNHMLCWFVTRGSGRNRCNCRLFMESDCFPSDAPEFVRKRMKNELIEAWNRRAEVTEKGNTMRTPKKKEYIADYDNWHFKSYWNEFTESWSVYQYEKTENGYELRCHLFMTVPVKTTEAAKDRVENWLKLLPIIEKTGENNG